MDDGKGLVSDGVKGTMSSVHDWGFALAAAILLNFSCSILFVLGTFLLLHRHWRLPIGTAWHLGCFFEEIVEIRFIAFNRVDPLSTY